MSNSAVPEILLVEDDPLAAELVRRVLLGSGIAHTLEILTDGDTALRRLHGAGEFAARAAPALVLLDLNLPGRDGREVLTEVRSTPSLAEIRVIVLSGSHQDSDVLNALANASAFVMKPVDPPLLVAAVARAMGTVPAGTPIARDAGRDRVSRRAGFVIALVTLLAIAIWVALAR